MKHKKKERKKKEILFIKIELIIITAIRILCTNLKRRKKAK